MSGYVDSQTWEAWFESYEVSWNNTSAVFVASVALSVALAVATWMTSGAPDDPGSRAGRGGERLEDIQEANGEDEEEEDEEDEEKEGTEGEGKGEDLEFDHLLTGKVNKSQRQSFDKAMEAQMSEEQMVEERKAQSAQLEAIFKMMKNQQEKFGDTTIDEIQDQMKLYCG